MPRPPLSAWRLGLALATASCGAARLPPAPHASPRRAPAVVEIPVPAFPGADAIWGGTGADAEGHVWVGVCARDVPLPSAHLFEYDPATAALTDRGDVVGALRRLGLHRDGEGQMKIHSKIVLAADGHLYFASMDEQGEAEDGSRLPTWGGHLWRLRLPERRWEHLATAPEALIAVSAGGPYVYALGYFDHVLYQYALATGAVRSVRVGAVEGHVSRNFLADARGHVYVPRVRRAAPGGPATATLVELDAALREVAATPLAHYEVANPTQSHGIVGVLPLSDGTTYFVTSMGFLYRVAPPSGEGSAAVAPVGWFRADGPSYTASLFTDADERVLAGVSQRRLDAPPGHDYAWLIYDRATGRRDALPFVVPGWRRQQQYDDALLYGSATCDRRGGCYVVGTALSVRRPLLLRVAW